MNLRVEAPLTAHQKGLIEEVAQRLAHGENPITLQQQGKYEEASILHTHLGYLDDPRLRNLLDERVKNLKDSPLTQQQEPAIKPKPRKKAKHYTLEDLHKEDKRRATPREILQTAESVRKRKKFLKDIGYDDKGIKEIIKVAAKRAIRRLQDAGVWGYIASREPLNPKTIALMQEKLRIYDAAHPPPRYYSRKADSYVDPDSSDGFSAHASPEAFQTAQEES